MKRVANRPMRARNELKTRENGRGGRNRLDFGTVRPRVQIRGPDQKSYSNRGLRLLRLARGGHRAQIFLEVGGGSPVQVDFEPSIELAHGCRTADISARARPKDREGFLRGHDLDSGAARITAGSDFGAEVKSHDHEPPPPFTLERLCKRPAVGSRP